MFSKNNRKIRAVLRSCRLCSESSTLRLVSIERCCKVFPREMCKCIAEAESESGTKRGELGECKRRLHTKASVASRRYREAYNRACWEATTGTPEDCRTWMFNATIFRFGSSSYYFSSPARRSACVGTSSVDGMKGSSFFLLAFRSTLRRLLDSNEHKGKASMEELFSSRGFYEHN